MWILIIRLFIPLIHNSRSYGTGKSRRSGPSDPPRSTFTHKSRRHNTVEGSSAANLETCIDSFDQSHVSSLQEDSDIETRSGRQVRSQMAIRKPIPRANSPQDMLLAVAALSKGADCLVSTAPISTEMKMKKKTKLERELEAHNESSELEAMTENAFNFDDEVFAVRKTRNVVKCLEKLANNEDLPPRPTQNLRNLMMEQFNPKQEQNLRLSEGRAGAISLAPRKGTRYIRRAVSVDEQEEKDGSESNIFEDHRCRADTLDPALSSSRLKKQNSKPALIGDIVQDTGRRAAWKEWDHQKGKCGFSYVNFQASVE